MCHLYMLSRVTVLRPDASLAKRSSARHCTLPPSTMSLCYMYTACCCSSLYIRRCLYLPETLNTFGCVAQLPSGVSPQS